MPVIVDEVTADVAPSREQCGAPAEREPREHRPLPCAERRQLRERNEYLQQRDVRVSAD